MPQPFEMRKSTSILSFLLILLAIYWVFHSMMPEYHENTKIAISSFSTDKALARVKAISKAPHAVGFPAHQTVQDYILWELSEMGLETSLQKGYSGGDWANFSKAVNIMARIKGSSAGKALVLLSHYDSSPHSSLGASDAGSGVATILEGIRAFLSENTIPANDIIILFTDAEELGLNGADLFVNEHPWANKVGLVLNFEARGSGGPSYMLIETNGGNANMIREFTRASPEYPVANSLVYSIYKMLPNDTDLTVFREDKDIEGFNFAFIDDHFDYHSQLDNYERLDRNSLAHQGSYLMPLLHYFGNSDLDSLKSTDDYVYFNLPFFKLLSYPFNWIWPMFGMALLLFLILTVQGFRKNVLLIREVGKGFLPLLMSLLLTGIMGYFSWPLLKSVYPQYKDILHGFTYNGHAYIAAFVFFSIGLCFWTYQKFQKVSTPNLLVPVILLWLVICALVNLYLPGAGFFIIPVYGLLASYLVFLNQETPSPFLMVILALPALWIYTPFIKMFPVGLGLTMMVAASVLTTLVFVLLLPVFSYYQRKSRWAYVSMFCFIACLTAAHFNSGFSVHNPKPTSLLYMLDSDTGSAKWVTYEQKVSDWAKVYLGATPEIPGLLGDKKISSKYGTGFSFLSDAPQKDIPAPVIEKIRDTLIAGDRFLTIRITPQRDVNRLEVYTNEIAILDAKINGIPLSPLFLQTRNGGKLVTHYISDNEFTELALKLPPDLALELTLYEASNDLLRNPLFSIPKRPEDAIPMPFVLNDAILLVKTLHY